MTRAEFIKKYGPHIIEAAAGTGLFPSVAMAQAIIETGDGKSVLAWKYNNFFGVKADSSWKGEKVLLPTREVINGKTVFINDYFRVYKTPTDSIRDRILFLKKNTRYTTHGVFTAKTPQEQAKALQAAGYATDPNYASIISSVIAGSKLTNLDLKKN